LRRRAEGADAEQQAPAARIDGMQRALDTLRPDVIMEMDADGQHQPQDIPLLLEKLAHMQGR